MGTCVEKMEGVEVGAKLLAGSGRYWKEERKGEWWMGKIKEAREEGGMGRAAQRKGWEKVSKWESE